MKKKSFSKYDFEDKILKVINKTDILINGPEKQLVLEVGNHTTRLIKYVIKPKEIKVLNGFLISTPVDSIKNDRIVNLDLIASLLKNSIKQAKIKEKEFVVSIASKEIITREMTTPQMSNRELNTFVKLNSADIFPVDLSKYVLGYNIIEKGESNRIMIAAIPKDIVKCYIELGKKIGLQLKGFNYSGYELYNFLNFELGVEEKTYLAVDIGARNTNVVIISNGVLKFNKIIPRGFSESVKWIVEEFGCDLIKAEQLKRQYNTLELNDNLSEYDEEYIVIKCIRRAFDNLIKDIYKLAQFYNINNAKNKIEKICIVGTTGKIKGIEDYFCEKLNLPIQAIKTLNKVNFNKNIVELKSKQLNFINCFGAHNLTGNEFFFIEDELKIRKIPLLLTKKFHKIAVLLILMLISLIVVNAYSLTLFDEKIQNYNEFIVSNSTIDIALTTINEQKIELEKLKEKVKLLPNSGALYLERLEVLDTKISELEKHINDLGIDATLIITNYEIDEGVLVAKISVETRYSLDNNQYANFANMANTLKSMIDTYYKNAGESVSIAISGNKTTNAKSLFTITIKFN